MRLMNLTPHDIVVQKSDGTRETYPACGIVARVDMKYTQIDKIAGVPLKKAEPRQIVGLPQYDENTIYIVSAMVAQAHHHSAFIAPDTGPSAIRNEKGQIEAVTGFVYYRGS